MIHNHTRALQKGREERGRTEGEREGGGGRKVEEEGGNRGGQESNVEG